MLLRPQKRGMIAVTVHKHGREHETGPEALSALDSLTGREGFSSCRIMVAHFGVLWLR